MEMFHDTRPVTGRERIKFKCSACGACCKNVKNSIALEPPDTFRIIRHKLQNGCTDSPDDILWDIADLKELSPGFNVFVVKTVNDGGVCSMLKNDRCTIYPVRPRTCRLYPFTAEPILSEHRIKWYLCTEQPHHFSGAIITAREWHKRTLSDEDEEYLYEECRVLPELGRLLRKIPEHNLLKAEQTVVVYRYLAYDFEQPFLSQFKDNMLFLKSLLSKLAE